MEHLLLAYLYFFIKTGNICVDTYFPISRRLLYIYVTHFKNKIVYSELWIGLMFMVPLMTGGIASLPQFFNSPAAIWPYHSHIY